MALVGMDKMVAVHKNAGVLGGQVRPPSKEQQVSGPGLRTGLFGAVAPGGGDEQVFAASLRPVGRVHARGFRLGAID